MISNTLPLVLGGCVLGACQLLAGVAIGMWVRRTAACGGNDRAGNDLQEASVIAKRLQSLASEMSSIVGEHRSELEQATQLLAADGRLSGDRTIADLVMNVVSDIALANQGLQAKLDLAEGRLQEQAVEIESHISRSLTDPLTGLPNRREFNTRLEERMGAWNRRRETFSLLLLDVDHFKRLNDQYGHLAGDQVLAVLGTALRGAIRREDAIARYGGEEFAILLPNTSLEQAAEVAHKVREAASRTIVQHNQHKIGVTMSGGLASILSSERVEAMIQRADAALYAAKAAGRNCAFAHDGVDCRLVDGNATLGATSSAARLVEAINGQPQEQQLVSELIECDPADFSAYLPREAVSAALAETCDELRRLLEDRGRVPATS